MQQTRTELASEEKDLKENSDYQTAKSEYLSLKKAHEAAVRAHEDALEKENKARAEHEEQLLKLKKMKKDFGFLKKRLRKHREDLGAAEAKLASYSESSATNPWTGKMGGVMGEEEIKPAVTTLKTTTLFYVLSGVVVSGVALFAITNAEHIRKMLTRRYY